MREDYDFSGGRRGAVIPSRHRPSETDPRVICKQFGMRPSNLARSARKATSLGQMRLEAIDRALKVTIGRRTNRTVIAVLVHAE